jgi:hypothetical protein
VQQAFDQKMCSLSDISDNSSHILLSTNTNDNKPKHHVNPRADPKHFTINHKLSNKTTTTTTTTVTNPLSNDLIKLANNNNNQLKPTRRHTIAIDHDHLNLLLIQHHHQTTQRDIPQNNKMKNTNILKKKPKTQLFRHSNLPPNPPRQASKSIANLPSFVAHNKTLYFNKKNQERAEPIMTKTTILNLSPLSSSASSVTTNSSVASSNSINSLVNNSITTKQQKLNKVATHLSSQVANTIETEAAACIENKDEKKMPKLFHANFVKQQSIQFNCTFESLI